MPRRIGFLFTNQYHDVPFEMTKSALTEMSFRTSLSMPSVYCMDMGQGMFLVNV